MTAREKRPELAGGLTVFPEAPGAFDRQVAEAMRALVLGAAARLEKPTRLALAAELGILRDRVTRLIDGLGIAGDFRKIQLEARAAKRLRK